MQKFIHDEGRYGDPIVLREVHRLKRTLVGCNISFDLIEWRWRSHSYSVIISFYTLVFLLANISLLYKSSVSQLVPMK